MRRDLQREMAKSQAAGQHAALLARLRYLQARTQLSLLDYALRMKKAMK